MNIYNDYENDQSQALKSTMNRFTHIICISDPQIMATEQANKIQDCTQNIYSWSGVYDLDFSRIVLKQNLCEADKITSLSCHKISSSIMSQQPIYGKPLDQHWSHYKQNVIELVNSYNFVSRSMAISSNSTKTLMQ